MICIQFYCFHIFLIIYNQYIYNIVLICFSNVLFVIFFVFVTLNILKYMYSYYVSVSFTHIFFCFWLLKMDHLLWFLCCWCSINTMITGKYTTLWYAFFISSLIYVFNYVRLYLISYQGTSHKF